MQTQAISQAVNVLASVVAEEIGSKLSQPMSEAQLSSKLHKMNLCTAVKKAVFEEFGFNDHISEVPWFLRRQASPFE